MKGRARDAISPGWLYKVSGAAAIMAALWLSIAALSLVTTTVQPAGSRFLQVFENNWLVVIFKLHAGFSGVHIGLLNVLDPLDVAILVCVALLFLGLYAALQRTRRAWCIVAAVQPFLGIVLFAVTKSAGRSAVMGAVLVISLVMLAGRLFEKALAYLGILASVLLLAGDFSAGLIPPMTIVAILFAFGYLCLMAWLFLVARTLFSLGAVERRAA